MKNLKRSAFGLSFLIALLCLCGCEKVPEATYRTSNPEVSVEKLFTDDGCTVYRFEDGGRTITLQSVRQARKLLPFHNIVKAAVKIALDILTKI